MIPRTRPQVKFHRRVVNATKRAFAPGREERMAAAQFKRRRKMEKRAYDADQMAIGEHKSAKRIRDHASSPDV